MNDNTLIAMAVIALVAYVPLTANIKKITGRENKVVRGSIRGYFMVFLICGLLMTGVLFGPALQWNLSSSGQAAVIGLSFVVANLIGQALFGRKIGATAV